MSTQWYFHTFRFDQFDKLCGNSTIKQRADLIKVLTDPDEFFDMEQDELNERSEIANSVLTEGIQYHDLPSKSAAILDEVVKMIFHRMGLAKAVSAKPVSPEPISLGLAEELAAIGKKRRPQSLLPLFDAGGRRFGETTFSSCNYVVFNRDEIWQLYEDFVSLAEDRSAGWNYPEVPEIINANLIPVFEAASKDPQLWLYGNLT